MDTFLHILEMIGTVAFAVSGAMTGIRKHLDIFGVTFLGIVTAVGGGIVRDVMIGITPPGCFRNPIYLEVAAVTALLFVILDAFGLSAMLTGILAAATVFLIRCLAAHFRWNFPKAAD